MTEQQRPYRSPLREEQASQTRDRILDSFTDLLADLRADEITTREIAERAGVSQPTVYRHFPDRTALLTGISGRIEARAPGLAGLVADGDRRVAPTIDDVGELFETLFIRSDEYAVEVRAEALLNADPRQYSPATRQHSAELLRVVADTFPELDERRRAHVAALLRCLGSSQAWLRMREEYGVAGVESGPLVRWAIDTLVAAVRDGQLPDIEPALPQDRDPR